MWKNKEVKVEVCHGTSCFVAEGKIVQELNEIVPKKYGNKVKLENCNCLGLCSIHWEKSKAPYVKVDNDIINYYKYGNKERIRSKNKNYA